MLETARKGFRRLLELTGLIGPYYRWRERRLALPAPEGFDDGLPLPPPEMIMTVSGTRGSPEWFSREGRAHAESFAQLAEEAGHPLSAGQRVLDLGCGVGRIARWLAPQVLRGGGAFTGCDINGRLVAWCAENLPGRYFENALSPPLKLEPASIDVLYAHSVLTHLREDTTRQWLAEIRRVLAPGGVAILTFHDETYARCWGPAAAAQQLAKRPFVVLNNALEGSNYMSAWTTVAHFAELASAHFELFRIIPGDESSPLQAIGVLRTAP